MRRANLCPANGDRFAGPGRVNDKFEFALPDLNESQRAVDRHKKDGPIAQRSSAWEGTCDAAVAKAAHLVSARGLKLTADGRHRRILILDSSNGKVPISVLFDVATDIVKCRATCRRIKRVVPKMTEHVTTADPPVRIAEILPAGNHFAGIEIDAFLAIENEVLLADRRCLNVSGVTVREAELRGHFVRKNDNWVYFCAGLTESVADCLRHRGWRASIGRVLTLQFADPVAAEAREDLAVPPIGQVIQGRQRSLVCAASIDERLALLETICRLHHDRHVLVITDNNATTADLARTMRMRTGWPTSFGATESRSEPWLHFVSVMGFVDRSYHIWPVVVFWDAGLVASLTALEQLAHMVGSIRYGFLEKNASYHVCDRLLIEAMFGPVLDLRSPTSGVPVGIAWLPPPAYPAQVVRNSLERKRTYLWHNTSRNRQIAEAARAIHGKETLKLRRLGLDGVLRDLDSCESISVAILAENLEHGRALQQHLPGWDLEHVTTNGSHEESIVARSVVMTLSRAETANLLTDVMIYAAGTGSFWRADREPASCTCYGMRLTVIDVQDDFDPQVTRDVAARAGCYGRLGWKELS